MLFIPNALGDEVCGTWSRGQLLEMHERFVAAMEQAFACGRESRAVASATVSSRNGKTAALESALESAFDLLVCNRGEVPAAAIVAL